MFFSHSLWDNDKELVSVDVLRMQGKKEQVVVPASLRQQNYLAKGYDGGGTVQEFFSISLYFYVRLSIDIMNSIRRIIGKFSINIARNETWQNMRNLEPRS